MKYLRDVVIAFIALFLMTFLWHNVILSGFYLDHLKEIGRFTTDGKLAVLMPFLAIGNVFAAIGFVQFVPSASKDLNGYLLNGFLMGLAITGSFVMFSHAIFYGWTGALATADLAYGLISGLIMGVVLMYLNPKK